MFYMKILLILLLSVTMTCNDNKPEVVTEVDKLTTTSTDNESVSGTGLDEHIYNLTTNCSVSVSASDIEKYHRVVAKATKLVYAHFHCNGTKWDVIKVLDEKSKYLLALGDYETYLMFSLNTLSSGIEHTSVRLHPLSEGCLTKPKDLNRTLMMLVSTNFQTLCNDGQCLENVCIKGTVTQCAVKDNGEYTLKEVTLNYAVALIVLISLIYITIAWILISEMGSFMFLPPHTEYHYSQDKKYTILDYNTYLIGKEQVPSGILSSCLSFLVQLIIPVESWLLKNRILIKSLQRRCVIIPISICFYFSITINQLPHHTFLSFNYLLSNTPLINLPFFVVLFSVWTIFENRITDDLPSKKIYCPIGVMFPTMRKLSSTLRNLLSNDQKNKALKNLFLIFLDLISFPCCFCVCPCISSFVTGYLFNTLIGTETISSPYFPLVLTCIVHYLKLSTRLSNWYKRFFEIVLDNVKSMADENVREAIQVSGKNSFHIVKYRSIVVKQGNLLQVIGVPIFIDETGSVMVTRSFFHKCVKLSIEHSRHNPLCLLMKCLFRLYFVIVLLSLQFVLAGQQSEAHLSLASLASGIIPLAMYFLEDDSIPIEDSDTLFKKHLKDLVNSYEEQFTVGPSCNENIQGDIPTEQNELTTLESSPSGQVQTAKPYVSIRSPTNMMQRRRVN